MGTQAIEERLFYKDTVQEYLRCLLANQVVVMRALSHMMAPEFKPLTEGYAKDLNKRAALTEEQILGTRESND